MIRRPPQAEADTQPWLTTFLDMITLLLTFFIMIYATTVPRGQDFEAMAQSLATRLNPDRVRDPGLAAQRNLPTLNQAAALSTDYLASLLRAQGAQDPVLSRMTLHRLPDRLVISLPADALFAPGVAEPTAGARRALFALGGVLANLPNRIEVQGHTDPTPVRGGRFADNWELSIARAIAVAAELRAVGVDRALTAQGMADTRFGEISAGYSETNRLAIGRRVDVVVHAARG